MKVVFKNVGLGDSIILEWEYKNEIKYGIIDCNKVGEKNPVLEYVQTMNPKEIEFILLSHFHFDHYSGFPELLDFCYQKNILIKMFFHTLAGNIVQVAQTNSNGYNSNQKRHVAHNFLKRLSLYSKNGIIKETLRLDNQRTPISLNEEIKIKIYAPLDKDYIKVENEIGKFLGGHTTTAPDINKTSTILKIEKDHEFILLTSDATRNAIKRMERFSKGSMLMAQVPHHGSRINHNKQFWSRNKKNIKQYSIISTGYDLKNKLPNKEPVEDIQELGYEVRSTNQVFGIGEVFGFPPHHEYDAPEVDLDNLLELDDIETNDTGLYDNLNGDQQFTFW